MKSLPRYLLIVFALAGDSTITKDLPMSYNHSLTSFRNLSKVINVKNKHLMKLTMTYHTQIPDIL